MAETKTDGTGAFALSTVERVPRRKLVIVAERVARLSPGEDPDDLTSLKTPKPIKNPDPNRSNRIVVPEGFVPRS